MASSKAASRLVSLLRSSLGMDVDEARRGLEGRAGLEAQGLPAASRRAPLPLPFRVLGRAPACRPPTGTHALSPPVCMCAQDSPRIFAALLPPNERKIAALR